MAENVLKLKRSAVKLGMDKSEARSANRAALEAFIEKASKQSGTKAAKKKSGATVAKKKSGAKTSTAKKTRSKSAPAAKKSAKTGKAKRAVTKNEGGRHLIGSIDFSNTDGWNPRDGSPVSEIFKALKKARGNVDKAFDALKGDVKDFVGTKKADGTKRTKDEMLTMLRYRINRTLWQFAVQTGQHETATDRVEYGTGPYASTRKKGAKKSSAKAKRAATKPNTRKATTGKKRGRPAKR